MLKVSGLAPNWDSQKATCGQVGEEGVGWPMLCTATEPPAARICLSRSTIAPRPSHEPLLPYASLLTTRKSIGSSSTTWNPPVTPAGREAVAWSPRIVIVLDDEVELDEVLNAGRSG